MKSTIKPGVSAAAILAGLLAQHGAATAQTTAPAASATISGVELSLTANAAPGFTVTPSVDFASDRWTVTSSSLVSPPGFYETGQYALLNIAADWALSPNMSLLLSVKNLADETYALVDGFPEECRNATLSLRVRN